MKEKKRERERERESLFKSTYSSLVSYLSCWSTGSWQENKEQSEKGKEDAKKNRATLALIIRSSASASAIPIIKEGPGKINKTKHTTICEEAGQKLIN